MGPKFIVGLGNPGEAYARTRHNVGFWVVDQFALSESYPPPRRKFLVKYTEKKIGAESVYLLEPETFMNRSGPAVRELLSYFGGKETLEALERSLLVVHDDLDLEEGRLRFRARGSSGGHRGVQSILESLGSDAFGRLKIGIGRRSGSDAADFVLENLSASSEVPIREACSRAAEALPLWLKDGVEACANRYNPSHSSSKSASKGGEPKIGESAAPAATGSKQIKNQSTQNRSTPGGQA